MGKLPLDFSRIGWFSMNERKIVCTKSLATGVFALVFGVAMVLSSGKVKGMYPRAVLIGLALLGMLEIVSHFKSHDGNAVGKIAFREIVVVLLLTINPLFAKSVGFYLTGFVEILAISLVFTGPKTVRRVLDNVFFALGTTAVGYLVFTLLLQINCPKGILL
jgi:hypothetical protein